jgi:hypothetical protein
MDSTTTSGYICMVLPRFGQKLEWLVIICSNKKVVQVDLEIDSRITDAGNSNPRQLKEKAEELERLVADELLKRQM